MGIGQYFEAILKNKIKIGISPQLMHNSPIKKNRLLMKKAAFLNSRLCNYSLANQGS